MIGITDNGRVHQVHQTTDACCPIDDTVFIADNKLLQETQLSLTNRATHLCKCNGVADLLQHAPPMYVTMPKFGRSRVKGCM